MGKSALAAPKRPFAQRPLSGRLDGRVSTRSGASRQLNQPAAACLLRGNQNRPWENDFPVPLCRELRVVAACFVSVNSAWGDDRSWLRLQARRAIKLMSRTRLVSEKSSGWVAWSFRISDHLPSRFVRKRCNEHYRLLASVCKPMNCI